jgi:hypothetical protein
MTIRPDETWHRLLNWTYGQAPSERLSAQILYAEGFRDIDPSHPLGGRDGGKDALAVRDGKRWIMASYFPRGQQPFSDIRAKFLSDWAGVGANGVDGMAFVTNQELRLAERRELTDAVHGPVELLHVEKVAGILDRPDMHAVRAQFLFIDPPTAAEASPARGFREIVDSSPTPSGAPDHRMLYDGMLLLQVAALPVPAIARHPAASDPREVLNQATERAQRCVADWPADASLLVRRLGQGWSAHGAHLWAAGESTDDAGALVRMPTAAVAVTTRDSALRMDRTWPTRIYTDHGEFAYYAAREPEVVAELVVTLAVTAELLEAAPGATGCDVALLLSAAPRGSHQLVSSERAVSGGSFGEPAGHITPPAEVPPYHLDHGRFTLAEIADGYAVAEQLLGPWLVQFRGDDLVAGLRSG